MNQLENELKKLFKRKEPSQDFAAHVLARIEQQPESNQFARRAARFIKRPVLRWAVVAAACVATIFGVVQHRREQQRQAQAERAREQAILALQITTATLNSALNKAQRVMVRALAAPENPKTRME